MKISIIHPSRKRPQLAFDTAQKWLSNAKQDSIEYILSIDSDDETALEYVNLFTSLSDNISIKVSDNKSSVEAINVAAEMTKGNLLIVVSDDFECFEGWDVWLLEKLEGQKDFIVKTTDTLQEWLITLPLMDRAYYERFGYIYYPGYKHMFSDTEMTEVAHLLGRVIDLRDKEHAFLHRHPCGGFVQKDETYLRNDETWNQGEELFNERKKANFYL